MVDSMVEIRLKENYTFEFRKQYDIDTRNMKFKTTTVRLNQNLKKQLA